MIPIGLGLVYAGYTIGLWGFCLIRGYNVPFTALFAQTWPGGTDAVGGGIPITPPADVVGGGLPITPPAAVRPANGRPLAQ